METIQTVKLRVDGLGLILYSPFAVESIPEGDDYYSTNHLYADQVVQHTNRGTLVDIATGTPGRFLLHVYLGRPRPEGVQAGDPILQLGIEVRDRQVHVRDVNDLMDWSRDTPPTQIISLDDGFYALTATSRRPDSGIWGDNQRINLYFDRVERLPELHFEDIPSLV